MINTIIVSHHGIPFVTLLLELLHYCKKII